MNHYEEVEAAITNILNDESISSYKLSKESGVPYNNIYQLRNGKRKIENLSFKVVGQLYKYALKKSSSK